MIYEFSPENKMLRCKPEFGEEIFQLGKLSAFVKPEVIKYSDDIMVERNIERVTFSLDKIINEIIGEPEI